MKRKLYKISGADSVNNSSNYFLNYSLSDYTAVVTPNVLISILKDPKYDEFSVREEVNEFINAETYVIKCIPVELMRDRLMLYLQTSIYLCEYTEYNGVHLSFDDPNKIYKFTNMFIEDVKNYDIGESISQNNLVSLETMKFELKSRDIEDKFIESLNSKIIKIGLKDSHYVIDGELLCNYPSDMVSYYGFLDSIQKSLVRRNRLKCFVKSFKEALDCNEGYKE